MAIMSNQNIHPQSRTIDGLSIRYVESEPRDDHALLLSPWPESIYCYEPTWNRLAEHTHLVAIDLPGFGQSERRDSLMSPRTMGEFIVRVADAFGLEQPHVVGPDVGTGAHLQEGDRGLRPARRGRIILPCRALCSRVNYAEHIRRAGTGGLGHGDLSRSLENPWRLVVRGCKAALHARAPVAPNLNVIGWDIAQAMRDLFLSSFLGAEASAPGHRLAEVAAPATGR
jgi:pimeloyl-ACP methyl ester carboxylesterase